MAEFKNPNQAGGGSQDNTSMLVVMIVMFGLVCGWQYYQAKHNPPTPAPSIRVP